MSDFDYCNGYLEHVSWADTTHRKRIYPRYVTAGITANVFVAFLGVIKGIFKLSDEDVQPKQMVDEE
ncbi:hypothetical protein [Kingella negevensis]|uniref:hypothetical protein n=1 Tax=Kingella negevensis TaxID=1522312 RepID=UPI00050A0D20|nr:hypothetical protein [Kingella negevensis]MDK4687697.1 hypothetical protein [Kingella negevensis]WII91307.1 hypothetical protein QEO93_01550 [Kingella negevensis]